MLSRFQSRVPALAGIGRRSLITQPTILDQGEHTCPVFLNPPSQPDFEFGDALRSQLEAKGVDLDYIDLRIFQVKQDNHEFDVPALPRERSGCWAYLWGNRYVKNQVLLETLKPEDDYLRGYLTSLTEEYRRKMKIHYPEIDVANRKAKQLALLNNQPRVFDRLYQDAKLEALSDFIQQDTEAYFNLYKNNSYISQYDEGDSFGYDIPAEMEAKLEGLMKLDWDKDAKSPNVGPYVQMITQLANFASPKFASMNPNLGATLQGLAKDFMSSSTSELQDFVTLLQTTSRTMCGEVPDKPSDAVAVVLKMLKPSGPLKPETAGAVVTAFRGRPSSIEAAALKGKSDADLQTQFSDVPEDRLSAMVQCANFSSGINEKNVAAVLISGLFANCPSLMTQFCMDDNNLQTFMSSNGGAFDGIASAAAVAGPASAEVSQSMGAASAGVQKWLQTVLALDKSGIETVMQELPTLMASCGKSTTPWMARAAAKAANDATGLDLIEANTFAKMFSNPEASQTAAMKVHDAVFVGGAVKSVAAACASDSFTDDLGQKLADYLLSSGKATPAQAEAVASKIGTVAELKAMVSTAAKAHEKFTAVDDAMLEVQWCVETMSIPSLMMAYQPLPHPSFSNVLAY